eukprot:TRINITY_DN10340_c0_g1_i2.p1 TRINITY_DN10340_c0_g1~~TRINITY_DN10340_c0_g1_i2.p1  ORF type:complete len:602 (+),score=80.39 TRINITY_DN10340_c0_g1_i2:120-1925(+)
MMRAAGLDMSTDGSRRRAGSCPPEGRMNSDTRNILGPGRAMRGVGASTANFGFGGLGSTFGGTSTLSSQLSAGGPSNITARIVRTDSTNSSLDSTNSSIPTAPGTLQLTVLVPVLMDASRRTEADVAQIGSNWTKGSVLEESTNEEVSAVQHHMDSCNTCRICLRAFQDGEKLAALPCAVDNCPSIWHEGCIRKWLCQGESPTCPLCRTRMELPGSAGKTSSGSAVAVEVRATLPLSTAMVMAANSSASGSTSRNSDATASDSFRGLGTAALNQLLRQLGQGIIQDILLLTLSQRSSFGFGTLAGNLQPMNVLPFFSNFRDLGATPSSPAASAIGSRTGSDPSSATALADLGTLLLRSLHSNGNLPVIIAVETRAASNSTAPGRADSGNPGTADANSRSSNTSHGGRKHWRKRGKAWKCQQRGSEATLPSDRHQCVRCEPRRQRGTWRENLDRSEDRHWPSEDSRFAGLASSGSRGSDQATSSSGLDLPAQKTKQWRWVPVGSRESPVSHASSPAIWGSTHSPVSHASSSVVSPVHPFSRRSEGSSDMPAETSGRQEENAQTQRRRAGRRMETWDVPAETWNRQARRYPQRKARWQRVADQ